MSEATAFSPASIGNLGIGFDILGQSFAGAGDRATVRRIQSGKVQISAIRNAPVALPLDAEKNTAGAALIALRSLLRPAWVFQSSRSSHSGRPIASQNRENTRAELAAMLMWPSLVGNTPVGMPVG